MNVVLLLGTKPILFGSPREGLKLLDLLEDWRFDLFPLCLLFPCKKEDLLLFFFFNRPAPGVAFSCPLLRRL